MHVWIVSVALALHQDGATREAQWPFASALAESRIAITPSPADGIEVRVVRNGSNEPLPGAIVAVVDRLRLYMARLELADAACDPDRLESLGAEFLRSDEHGVVRVPRGDTEIAWLIGELGPLRGARSLVFSSEKDGSDPHLVLAPPAAVRVAVVDALGGPAAGVAVEFKELKAWTGESGIAEFADLELDARSWLDERDEDGGWQPRVELPFVEVDGPWIDPMSPPADPILLQLPACGEIEIRLIDSQGLPVEAGGVVWVESANRSRRWPSALVRLDPSGTTVVRCGAVGVPMRLEFDLDELDALTVEATAPSAAGKRVEVVVRLPDRHALLVGRVLDAERSPIVARHVRAWISAGSRATDWAREASTELDSSGRFRFDLDPSEPLLDAIRESQSPPLLILRAFSDPVFETGPIALPELTPSGVTDVGDVVLAPAPVRMRGVVVDETGQAVPWAYLHAVLRPAPATLPPIDESTQCDGAGLFEIRSLFEVESFSILTLRGGKRAFTRERDDEEGLRLVITRSGAIEGVLAGAPAAPRTPAVPDVPVSIRVLDPDGQTCERVPAEKIGSDGSFCIDPLEPGRYVLEVVLSKGGRRGEVIQRIEDVEVHAGESTKDPRLAALDARSRTRIVAVEVLTDRNVRAPWAEATTIPADGRCSDWIVDAPEGVAHVPTAQESVDVLVWARGFRPTRIPAVTDRATVVLERAIPVRFIVEPLAKELAGFEPAQLSLRPAAGAFPARWCEVERPFLEGAEAIAEVPLPGLYAGSIGLREPGVDMLRGCALHPFEIEDGPGVRTIRLTLDPALLKD